MRTDAERHRRERWHTPLWVSVYLFLAIAVFFLWQEHRAHLLGALPYLLLVLCPVIHLLTHRGHHGGHQAHRNGTDHRTSS